MQGIAGADLAGWVEIGNVVLDLLLLVFLNGTKAKYYEILVQITALRAEVSEKLASLSVTIKNHEERLLELEKLFPRKVKESD